ncbi:MAG: precorrin-6y C5,15-methyltransferase (decarboxylating) subunit CbiE [Actinomycetota bacterium]|nr:precorrin-6y C5,15-methyltransferase (decarboxylating) subunit CbiE [Actinomycetota bacterium]
MAERVDVVGLVGGEWFGPDAVAALRAADVIVGANRHLDAVPTDAAGERVRLGAVAGLVDLVEQRTGRISVLASGDPGFFGIGRLLVGRFGSMVRLHPAPSSVALAFARAGLCWDDATVVSCHGRSLDAALDTLVDERKVAVLCSPEVPPEAIGAALVERGVAERDIWVASRLGENDESVSHTDLAGLAAGRFEALSVVVMVAPGAAVAPDARLRWGRPVHCYEHRASMITKPEVRAVVLSKLELAGASTLWDVGAASGSVAIEACRLAPGLRAWAAERRADDCDRIRGNAADVPVTVVEGEAPGCLADLPDPDRAFVGGGGLDVLDAVRARVRAGGVVVATYATLGPADAAAARLGELVQLQVSRARPIGSTPERRLEAENPVFVAWGTIS